MYVYVVVAHDQTGYRLVKAFSKEADAEKYRTLLTDLLWRRVTIEQVLVDKEVEFLCKA